MKKRDRILIATAVLLVSLAIVLATVLPLKFSNARNNAAPLSSAECEQNVYIYDDDYNLVDTLHSVDTVYGVELKDIGKENSVAYAHHVRNEFVGLYGVKREIIKFGELEKLDELSYAEYGTLQFVFFNLDPASQSFDADREAVLSRFAYNNSSAANIDLFLPACFDSATVYCNSQYICTIGYMQDYDPAEYIDKYYSSSAFVLNSTDLEPRHIDITFSVGQNTISPDRLEAAKIVTVHYRAKRGLSFSSAMPLVGDRDELRGARSSASAAHIVLLAVTAVIFVTFVALSLLKKAKNAIHIAIALGGTILLIISELMVFTADAALGSALSAVAAVIISCAPLLAVPPKTGGLQKARYIAMGAAVINVAVGCVLPFVASAAATRVFLQAGSIVFTAISVAMLVAEYVIRAQSQKPHETAILATLCAAAAITKGWTIISPTFVHPCIFISFMITALALWNIGVAFFRTEKREAMLRINLRKEADIQTATLKTAVADREKLLSFVSHDMRKSALGIDSLISDLKNTQPSDDVVNIANKIKNKNDIMLKSMSEILTYAERNYSDEPFDSVSVRDLFEELKQQVQDDCEANGITLTAATKNLTCRARKNTLLSVLFNLVFNAIEHAECTRITLSAAAHGDDIEITIADNGIGAGMDMNIFSPFATGGEAQSNSGLGLFIVKSQTENMGGSISYAANENGSAFTLTLLRTY